MTNIKKNYLKNFQFLVVKFSIYLNRHVFVMVLHMNSIKPSLWFSWFCAFFVSKGGPFWLLFYSIVAGVVPCGGRKKVSPCIIIVQVIFYFLRGHWAHPGYFENRIPLKPALGGACSLADYSIAYEGNLSNRVSDFRDFLCFQRRSFFTFISGLLWKNNTWPGLVLTFV